MDVAAEFARSWGWLLSLVLCGVWTWGNWSLRKEFQTRDRCEKHRSERAKACEGHRKECAQGMGRRHTDDGRRIEALEKQVAVQGQALSELPTRKELQELNASVAGLSSMLKGIQHPLRLLMEHHRGDTKS